MRIKNKIGLLFILFIFLIIMSGVLISFIFRNNYKEIKFNNAYAYEKKYEPTVDEYADYLIKKGFIVTRTQLDNYGDFVCHKEEIIGYDGANPAFYATLNENIMNDFLLLMDYVLLGIVLITIVLVIILYYLFNKLVLKRVIYLENNIIKYNNNADIDEILLHLNLSKYKDEIASLEHKFKEMLIQIRYNEKSKQKLIIALSHELKSPLVKIDAILDMYNEGVCGYEEKEKVINLLKEESKAMIDNINNLLNFYSNSEESIKVEKININEKIKEIFFDEIFDSKKISFNMIEESVIEHELDTNRFTIVLNNIKNNIYSHSEEETEVDIKVAHNKVVMTNLIREKQFKSSKVGNIIDEYLADDLNIKIEKEKIDGKYIVTIIFENDRKNLLK